MKQTGPLERRLTAHYSAVRRRVAYPPKPPIAVVERVWRPKRLIRAANSEPARPKPAKCNVGKLRNLYDSGLSYLAISHNMGLSPRTVCRYIEKFGWTR